MNKVINLRVIRQTAMVFLVGAATSLTACSYLRTKRPTQPISDVLKVVPEKGYKPDTRFGTLDLQANASVDRWVGYFTGRGRNFMQLYLSRSARYIPLMKATFRDRGMPENLAYIAMIESGLNANAFSYASAVGYWQFIRATGRRYNLRIDGYVDERRDPILSTEAAATYLDSLYSVFGNWYLALAAYNTGEGRVMRAVMRYHTRDFWQLCHYRRALPRQTKNYIPKFIAAVLIATHPKEYGFNNVDSQPAFTFDSVVINRPISLEQLAKELNVDYDEIKLMNPRYKSDYVPVYADRVNAIRVPVGMKKLAMTGLAGAYSSGPKYYVTTFEYYRVHRGDNLGFIARRFDTTIARLVDMNNISRHSLIRAGRLMRVPEFGTAGWHHAHRARTSRYARDIASRALVSDIASNTSRSGYYRVHRGDNLISIARKFHTTVGQILVLNHLSRHSLIRAGRSLKVGGVNTATNHHIRRLAMSSRVANADSAHDNIHGNIHDNIHGRVHIVRRGENLSSIAHHYHVSISQIAHANSLRKHSVLLAGTELIIPDHEL